MSTVRHHPLRRAGQLRFLVDQIEQGLVAFRKNDKGEQTKLSPGILRWFTAPAAIAKQVIRADSAMTSASWNLLLYAIAASPTSTRGSLPRSPTCIAR